MNSIIHICQGFWIQVQNSYFVEQLFSEQLLLQGTFRWQLLIMDMLKILQIAGSSDSWTRVHYWKANWCRYENRQICPHMKIVYKIFPTITTYMLLDMQWQFENIGIGILAQYRHWHQQWKKIIFDSRFFFIWKNRTFISNTPQYPIFLTITTIYIFEEGVSCYKSYNYSKIL